MEICEGKMIYIYVLLGVAVISVGALVLLALESAWIDKINDERWRDEQ